MRIVLLGPPGAGKGTIASLLGSYYQVPWISTGDLFRSHLAKQTKLGQLAAACIAGGGLVPDDMTCAMVAERLGKPDARRGFILDGFPRTCSQADVLSSLLSQAGWVLDTAVAITCPDCLIIDRLKNRRVCQNCGCSYNLESRPPQRDGCCDTCSGPLQSRADDRPDIVAARLSTYRTQTAPLLDYYRRRGLLVEIDNSATIPSDNWCLALAVPGTL